MTVQEIKELQRDMELLSTIWYGLSAYTKDAISNGFVGMRDKALLEVLIHSSIRTSSENCSSGINDN